MRKINHYDANIVTNMQMNHGNKANQDSTHGSYAAKTHKTRVTKQVSRTSCDKDTIESAEKEEMWRFRVRFTVDLSSSNVSLSCSDQHRQLRCQIITLLSKWRSKNTSLYHSWTPKHGNIFSLLQPSLPFGLHIYFCPFPNHLLLTSLLIRYYANDPKTVRKCVCQCGCYSVCMCTVS